jgi:hypothetical protein
MFNYKPEESIHHVDEYETINSLRCLLSRFSFPLGQSSEVKAVLEGILNNLRNTGQPESYLFIPLDQEAAASQYENITAEIETILKRQQEECMPEEILPNVEPKTIDNSVIFSEIAEKLINDYLEKLSFYYSLDEIV